MRKRKYQGWHKEEKRMFPVLSFDCYEVIEAGYFKGFEANGPFRVNSFKAEDVIIRDFTGLRDKNGKEIYEGDILRPDAPGFVMFGLFSVTYKNAGFVCGNGRAVYVDAETWHETEIIGNIYENPELLNQ